MLGDPSSERRHMVNLQAGRGKRQVAEGMADGPPARSNMSAITTVPGVSGDCPGRQPARATRLSKQAGSRLAHDSHDSGFQSPNWEEMPGRHTPCEDVNDVELLWVVAGQQP